MSKRIVWLGVLAIVVNSVTALALPVPKEGLLVAKDRVDEVRARINGLKNKQRLNGIIARAEKGLAEWPEVKKAVEPKIDGVLDLLWAGNPKDFTPPEAGETAGKLNRMLSNTPSMAFRYLMTGDKRYAQACYEIIEMCGRLPRWGWFNWDGANLPQIHYGFLVRHAAFAIDWCWDGWDDAQKEKAVNILAEKGVEHYWRLVSLSPFMGLRHLRAKNQGNNALGAAMVASLAVGDSVPENKVWLDSLLHTYAWIVAHDIGWAGQGLEPGMPGYWSVSMQNLYTAAASLYNARGIDLRVHPGIAEATWNAIYHQATVPQGLSPYKGDTTGASSIITGKPISLPGGQTGGPWWYDYAARFLETPALYFINQEMVTRDKEGKTYFKVHDCHQGGHSEVIGLMWTDPKLYQPDAQGPKDLFKSTDRMTMFRSGYGSPHTYLYFNGDFFLSARNEILRVTTGLGWHWPSHQYALVESVLETEDELLSPSMVVSGMFDSDFVSMTHTYSGCSNVSYYRQTGQDDSYKAYKVRDRDIAYVRSPNHDEIYDYFLFIDKVEQEGMKWHGVNWHVWNSPKSPGSCDILGKNMAIGRRPNADILLATLSHNKVDYEQQGVSSQSSGYHDDHNALLLRAVLGGYESTGEKKIVLPVKLWSEGDKAAVDGRNTMHMIDFKLKEPTFHTPVKLLPVGRYRMSVETKKKDAPVYENTAWVIDFKLLDKAGEVIAEAIGSTRAGVPLRLTDPQSLVNTYDWKTTVTHFNAPENVAFIEAKFAAAHWSHPPYGLKPESEIWLSDITVTPLGRPHRSGKELAVTLAMPLPKNAEVPNIQAKRRRDGFSAKIAHPDGTVDTVTFDAEGRPNITRKGGGIQQTFAWDSKNLSVGRRSIEADAPVHGAFKVEGGKLTGKVTLASAATVKVAGKKFTLQSGSHFYDGRFKVDASEASLVSNSPENQEKLRKGLENWARPHREARDKYTKLGWKNIALEAIEVSATSVRDKRFGAEHVIDNRVCEFPADGTLDYTMGPIKTTQGFGYGKMEHMSYLAGFEGQSVWPFYVRPTYWLLPPRQLGEVTIRLKKPTKIKMVRVLNTTNGGLNDFATMGFHVDLLMPGKFPQWSNKFEFGRAWDRAFDAAFKIPEFFGSYGMAFEGMLEPGVKVPFGAGWVDVEVDYAGLVEYVRITVDTFWAMGGGINEIQIYPAQEQ